MWEMLHKRQFFVSENKLVPQLQPTFYEQIIKIDWEIDFVSLFPWNDNKLSSVKGHFTLTEIDDKSDVIEQCIIYTLQNLPTQTKSETFL